MNTKERDDLVKLDKYIKYLKENKPQKKERTFFHFYGKGKGIKYLGEDENYISDILSMFFDTNNSHGYGDLFIKALLECLNEKYETDFKSTKCSSWREVNCDGTRLDIVLECGDYVFGLEHKVKSKAENPFKTYKKFLNKKYTNQGFKEKNINLVLFTLEDYDSDDEIEEKESIDYYINYTEFFKKLNKMKDEYPNKSKYKVYLEDLLLNINILQEGEFEPVEERDKKLLELIVENPDIFDVRDRAIEEIFSDEGFLYEKMSAYIEKKDLLRDIEIEYYPSRQRFTEVHINFHLKRKKDSPHFTIMYNVDDGDNLELLKWYEVKYEVKFEYEPSFASCWSEVWWNNKHPVYELEHKLYEDGFEKEFLDKAKEIFRFVEKALDS